jgi:GntR family transcriptional regulator
LAVELQVNPNTVIKAYSELEREGLLTSEQGSGTFIAAHPNEPISTGERRAKLESLCTEFLSQAARYSFTAAEVLDAIGALTTRRSSS